LGILKEPLVLISRKKIPVTILQKSITEAYATSDVSFGARELDDALDDMTVREYGAQH
jgi:hypothetical protein